MQSSTPDKPILSACKSGDIFSRMRYFAIEFLFLAILCMPLAEHFLRWDPRPAPGENRTLNVRPGFPKSVAALVAWPAAFDAYYRDYFGWRNSLIHACNYIKVFGVGVSPHPESVVLGKQGWLYHGSAQVTDTYRCTAALTDEKSAAPEENTASIQQALDKLGIPYLEVWTTTKNNVYPEYLPDWMTKTQGVPVLDQYLRLHAKNAASHILDLRPALLEAKKDRLIYFKADSHWNSVGGYMAYREMAARIRTWLPNFRATPPEEIEWGVSKGYVGDLAKMLDLQSQFAEDAPAASVKNIRWHEVGRTLDGVNLPKHAELLVTETEDDSRPKVVFFHDSFGRAILPFIAQDFRRAVCVRNPSFSLEIVEKERPDMVIRLTVDWHLAAARGAKPSEL
jgi:alginate O-acetyltransferase complex protein AlgJ